MFRPTPEELEHWATRGYIIRQGVFSSEECEAMKQRAGELAIGQRPFPSPNRKLNALVEAGKVTGYAGTGCMHSITAPHVFDDIFLNRVRDSRLTDVVAGILGPDLVSNNTLFIFKAPRIGMGFPWHQDKWYFQKLLQTETTVGTWQAMDDADVGNGALWVIPGSHKLDILEHDELEGPQQREYKKARVPDDSAAIPVEIPAGSVLWFHSHLLHRSTVNESDRYRRVYVAHYISARATYLPTAKYRPPTLRVRGQTYPGRVEACVEEVIPEEQWPK